MSDLTQKTVSTSDTSHYDLAHEIKQFEAFLEAQGLRVPENFIRNIKAGDVIEIYAFPEHKQIYANQEFSRLSSYTPEQMQTLPFQQLFWRDDEVQKQLLERAAAVASNMTEAVRWDLPPHELIENLHPRKRTFEMAMGWISPCVDAKTGKQRAWVSTLQVSLIYEWPEAI